jgi:hypothetical protein
MRDDVQPRRFVDLEGVEPVQHAGHPRRQRPKSQHAGEPSTGERGQHADEQHGHVVREDRIAAERQHRGHRHAREQAMIREGERAR